MSFLQNQCTFSTEKLITCRKAQRAYKQIAGTEKESLVERQDL